MSDTLIDYLDDNGCACKKQIFATHQRYYIANNGIPPNTVAYQLTNTFVGEGLTADTGYIHLVYSITNGSAGTPFGNDLQDYFASPHTGVIATKILVIQAMIDAALAEMGLSQGDIIYAVNTDNEPIFFLTPAAEAAIASNTYLHIYFGGVDTWNNYTQKADVTALASNSNVLLGGSGEQCIPIQEIKEKDSCTGEETYRYVIENGLGVLVPVLNIYPYFTESDVALNCPSYTYVQKEVCVTIDGSVEDYEVIKIEKRNSLYELVNSSYETKQGVPITGVITEVCCNCNSVCDYNLTPLRNMRCVGYAGNNDPNLSKSSWMQGYGRHTQAYWDATCGVGSVSAYTWELDSVIINGTQYITTPIIVTIPFASMTLTPSGVPTNFATVFNTFLNPLGINLDPDMTVKEFISGDVFSLAFRQYSSPIACSYVGGRLDIITDTGDCWEYIAGTTLSAIQTFMMANNFPNLISNSSCATI